MECTYGNTKYGIWDAGCGIWTMGCRLWDRGSGMQSVGCRTGVTLQLGMSPPLAPEMITQINPSPAKVVPTRSSPGQAGAGGPRGLGEFLQSPCFRSQLLVPLLLPPQLCQEAETPGTEPWHGQPNPRDAPAASWHADTEATASPFLPPSSRNSCSTFSIFILLLHVIEKAMAVK